MNAATLFETPGNGNHRGRTGATARPSQPHRVEAQSSAADVMAKAQTAMLALADFMQAVRRHQERREKSAVENQFTATRPNYTPTDHGHRPELAAGVQCPACGDEMRRRTSAYGDFFGCINYPTCQGKRDSKGKVPTPRKRSP